MLALLGTSFTFLMTALGAATVFFFARKVCERAQGALLGFAAGVMTAASVWSLILPAIEQTAAEGRLPPFLPAAAGIVLGALTARRCSTSSCGGAGGEQVSTAIFCCSRPSRCTTSPRAWPSALRSRSRRTGRALPARAALALGIGVQNFPEGAAVALPLYQSGQVEAARLL